MATFCSFRVLNNYLVWQTVRMFTGCLSKAFRDAYKGLRKALMGSEGGEEPQWRYCVQDTNNVLGTLRSLHLRIYKALVPLQDLQLVQFS